MVIGAILCIDNSICSGYGDLTSMLTVGKKYYYTKKEMYSSPFIPYKKDYQYYVLCDDGACRVFADYRFKDICKLREEKLDFLLDGIEG